MKSVESHTAEEETSSKKAKKSVSISVEQTKVVKEMTNGLKKTKKKMKSSAMLESCVENGERRRKKNVSCEEEESAIKKTKKSTLRRIKLKELDSKKKKKSSLAKKDLIESQVEMSGTRKEKHIDEEPVEKKKKKKKKSLFTKIELGESSLDNGELKRQKKKLSKIGKKPTIKKTKNSSLEVEEVSHTDEEPAKKKKKKTSLTKIETETSSVISQLRKKNKLSHMDKESAIKKTKKSSHTDITLVKKKKKKGLLTKIEVPETSPEISERRKKKKLCQTNKEPLAKKMKKRSLAQRELEESPAEMSRFRKKEEVSNSHTDKESAEKKKKKSACTKKELPETSLDVSEPRKKKKLSEADREPTIKKRRKSSLVQPEPQESHLEINGMRKEEEDFHTRETAEFLGEMNGLRKEMELLNSEEESSENKTKESYSTETEPLESSQMAEVAYQAKIDSPQRVLVVQESWSQAVASIVYDSASLFAPITVVCGAKNSGKSTFCRFLLNNIIQRYGKVAYLETDVGQAEFTPPGFISLIVLEKQIPSFADLTDQLLEVPERCFFYGDISSKRDPNAYLKYITSLYDHFRSEYYMLNESGNHGKPQLPLVVNTPGWVKGIGYDILVEMLKYIAPTHMVQIRVPLESKNLPVGPFWLNEDHEEPVHLFEIGAVYHDHSGRWLSRQKDSKSMRERKIFHYFRQCFPSDLNITSWKDLAYALASLPPYEVPLSSVKVRHLYCQVPSSEVLHSLNATIVGLAVSSAESRDLELCTPLCVGLGIVRGIDISKGLLYVLTPVPQSNLKNVDLLLQGYVQIPSYLLQVPGCRSPYMSEHVHITPRP